MRARSRNSLPICAPARSERWRSSNCNPAYAAPAAHGFAEALKRVQSTLHFGLHRDETGDLCEWQLPLAHELECWSDARAVDGTATIIQPTIEPFYDVRSVHQMVAMLLGETDLAADAAVRETWRASFGPEFDARWKQALRDGFIEGPAEGVNATAVSTPGQVEATSGEGLDVVFRPDPTIWDGRFANIGWLQELPKPLTTLTWGNVVAVGPALAKRLSIRNGDHIEVTIGDRSVVGPAWIMPGQAENTVGLSLGYGRRRAGRVGDGLGYDAYGVMPLDQPWMARGNLRKLGTAETLAVTQLHHHMEGFDPVREVSAQQPDAATAGDAGEPLPSVAFVEKRLGHGDRPRLLHWLQCMRCGLHGRKQCRSCRQGAGYRRPGDALAQDRTLLRRRVGKAAQLLPAGALHALRAGSLRDGVSGACDVP